jgi:hypothetical protein
LTEFLPPSSLTRFLSPSGLTRGSITPAEAQPPGKSLDARVKPGHDKAVTGRQS